MEIRNPRFVSGVAHQVLPPLPRKQQSTSQTSYMEFATLDRPMAPNLLNTPGAPSTRQLLQQFGSGLSSRNLHEPPQLLNAAKKSYAQNQTRYLQICSDPTTYAPLINIHSREQAMWKLRQEIYQELAAYQAGQRNYWQPHDRTLIEPQANHVKLMEEYIYISFYELSQRVKAHIRKIKEFILPVVRSVSDRAPEHEILDSGNRMIRILKEKELSRGQWKYETVGDLMIMEGHWLCPDTDHSEAPQLNLDGQQLSDTSSNNNPAFPLWRRNRVAFVKKIYEERKGHLSRWLQENGILATQVDIKTSSLFYAMVYDSREKITQILQQSTARVSSCRLMTERSDVSCEVQAPLAKDIYEQLQAIWQSLFEMLVLWEKFLQIYRTVIGRKQVTP